MTGQGAQIDTTTAQGKLVFGIFGGNCGYFRGDRRFEPVLLVAMPMPNM